MQITSGKFEADMFTMTNATNFETNQNYTVPATEVLTLDGSNDVSLLHDPVAGTISVAARDFKIDNVTQSIFEDTDQEPVPAGHYKLTAASGSTPAKIKFANNDIQGRTVEISYLYKVEAQEALIDNRSSAMGEAIMVYPVYGNGDDCTDSSIIGHVYVRVFKCRVTAQPGFDASYKTANTFQFTLAAMDAKRNEDEACYSIAYIKK